MANTFPINPFGISPSGGYGWIYPNPVQTIVHPPTPTPKQGLPPDEPEQAKEPTSKDESDLQIYRELKACQCTFWTAYTGKEHSCESCNGSVSSDSIYLLNLRSSITTAASTLCGAGHESISKQLLCDWYAFCRTNGFALNDRT